MLTYSTSFDALSLPACSPPEGANGITEDTRLLLYALHEQATRGPCVVPRPTAYFYDGDDAIDWEAWRSLGDMSSLEAMRLHCAAVERDNPNWWALLTSGLDDQSVRAIVETARSCTREYHDAVRAGTLVPPRLPATRERIDPAAAAAAAPTRAVAASSSSDASSSSSSSSLKWMDAYGLETLRASLDAVNAAVTYPFEQLSAALATPVGLGASATASSTAATTTRSLLSNLRLTRSGSMPSLLGTPTATRRSNSMMSELADVIETETMNDLDEAEAHGVNPPVYTPLDEIVPLAVWRAPKTNGTGPRARYQHCAWRRGAEMWISHGSANGRKLNGDAHVLDVETLTWGVREEKAGGGAFAAAAAVAAPDGTVALALGGVERQSDGGAPKTAIPIIAHRWLNLEDDSDDEDDALAATASASNANANATLAPLLAMRVREPIEWVDDVYPFTPSNGSTAAPKGPRPRAAHSANVVGREVLVYGGVALAPGGARLQGEEETLGDLWVYSIDDAEWRCPWRWGEDGEKEKEGARGPTPRSGHVACVAKDRYLLVFGGGAGNVLASNDLHAYDCENGAWIDVAARGEAPSPRSGHAACVVENSWYVCGGGDGERATPETYRLDFSDIDEKVVRWSAMDPGTDENAVRAAGKEGLSLVPFRGSTGDFILAFGGSDGTCSDALSAMRVSNVDRCR